MEAHHRGRLFQAPRRPGRAPAGHCQEDEGDNTVKKGLKTSYSKLKYYFRSRTNDILLRTQLIGRLRIISRYIQKCVKKSKA